MDEIKTQSFPLEKSQNLKLLALLSMVIDHLGYVFFPEYEWMRVIGRLAFPIFSYQIAIGMIKTSNRFNYIKRLWIFALVSQVPYTLLFDTFNLNIMFAFFLSAFLIWRLQNKDYTWLVPVFVIVEGFNFEYGMLGVALPLLFFIVESSPKGKLEKLLASFVAMMTVTVFFCLIRESFFQMPSLLALIPIWFLNIDKKLVNIPNRFYYWFYPVHLAIMFAVKWIPVLIS